MKNYIENRDYYRIRLNRESASHIRKDSYVREELKSCGAVMTRWLAENQIENLEHIKRFDRLGYTFLEKHSTKDRFVFLKKETKYNEWEMVM